MIQPYDVDASDRMAVNRLRKAADRGDERAKLTLAQVTQQQHTERWDAAEQARTDRHDAIANRKRPSSVSAAMSTLRAARDEKTKRTAEARAQQDAERADHHAYGQQTARDRTRGL